jgi:nicotinic acid mononucleotide adenylyltransferase
MKKLAVFGTSSNPFCLHHGECLRWLVEEGGFDHVLVVPSAAHALKKDLPPFAHRLAVAKIGVDALPLPIASRVEVTSIEEELRDGEGPVYAYDLLRAVHVRWKEFSEIRFSIGSDIFAELHRWKFVAEIERDFGFTQLPSLGTHATEVRRKIAEGDPSWRSLVCDGVVDYLERHNLYLR